MSRQTAVRLFLLLIVVLLGSADLHALKITCPRAAVAGYPVDITVEEVKGEGLAVTVDGEEVTLLPAEAEAYPHATELPAMTWGRHTVTVGDSLRLWSRIIAIGLPTISL